MPKAEFFPEKIVSGGQTGADRGGLIFAIEAGIPHGGWCPKGRKAEDGPIPEIYLLQETASADYLKRTEWNARDSDATAIFCFEDAPTGGTKRTVDFAKKHGRPFILVRSSMNDPASTLLEWLKANRPKVLNVAGPRESKAPGIQEFARRVLMQAWEVRHG